MTQIINAKKGNITEEMRAAALVEGLSPETVMAGVAEGTITLAKNKLHTSIQPLAIGKGTRTKVNANIGTSKDNVDIDIELAKLHAAIALGADAVMDRRLPRGGVLDVTKDHFAADFCIE